MFICRDCIEEKGIEGVFFSSRGLCELCRKHGICTDIHSSRLPDPHHPETVNVIEYSPHVTGTRPCGSCKRPSSVLYNNLCKGCSPKFALDVSEVSPENFSNLKNQINKIYDVIFKLAKESPNLKVMSQYMWLADCFENYEFNSDDASQASWNISCLADMGEPVDELGKLIQEITGENPIKPIDEFMRESRKEECKDG